MSKLKQLEGKSKVYNIGGVELEIFPLGLDDMSLLSINKDAPQKEQTEMTLKLINKVLEESVPDSTEEERSKVGLNHMEAIMDAVMEVNGMDDKKDKRTDKLKDRIDAIKARQNTK